MLLALIIFNIISLLILNFILIESTFLFHFFFVAKIIAKNMIPKAEKEKKGETLRAPWRLAGKDV